MTKPVKAWALWVKYPKASDEGFIVLPAYRTRAEVLCHDRAFSRLAQYKAVRVTITMDEGDDT